jgi:hypothetical protein
MNYLHMQNQFCNQKNCSDHPIQTAIRAELIGSDCCSALGMTARSTAPVLALCRALVTAGKDPNRPLHAYRGDVLCLRVPSIGQAAQFTVEDDRHGKPRLRRWRNGARGYGAAPLAQRGCERWLGTTPQKIRSSEVCQHLRRSSPSNGGPKR